MLNYYLNGVAESIIAESFSLGFSFALMYFVVLVVWDIDFIADFDGFIGYATNVLLKMFGFAVRMSAQDKPVGLFFGQFVDIYIDILFCLPFRLVLNKKIDNRNNF